MGSPGARPDPSSYWLETALVALSIVASQVGAHRSRQDKARRSPPAWIEGPSTKLGQATSISTNTAHLGVRRAPEETMGAYEPCWPSRARCRAIGASSTLAPSTAGHAALKTSDRSKFPRYQTLQPRYNLIRRASFEGATETLGFCPENQLGSRFRAFAGARLRLPHRQVPRRGGPGQEQAQLRREEFPQRARLPHPRRPGRGRRPHRFEPRAGRARLADRAAAGDRAHHQRHQPGAAGQSDRRHPPAPGCRPPSPA